MTEPFQDQAVATPRPGLRGLVHRYTGHTFRGFPPGFHAGLPSRHLTLMISLEDPFDVTALPNGGHGAGRHQSFVGGLHSGPAAVAHDGRGCGVGVALTPAGARSLLGMPAGALTNSVVDLGLVWRGADELAGRMAAEPDWRRRFALVDAWLTGRLDDARTPGAEVDWVWRRLAASGGRVTVNELASAVGWSRRHLSTRFTAEFGLGPKEAARVLRFERACWLLGQDGHPGIARVAVMCGYYDQAHLNNEWRDIAGMTPTEWMSAELRDPPDELPG